MTHFGNDIHDPIDSSYSFREYGFDARSRSVPSSGSRTSSELLYPNAGMNFPFSIVSPRNRDNRVEPSLQEVLRPPLPVTRKTSLEAYGSRPTSSFEPNTRTLLQEELAILDAAFRSSEKTDSRWHMVREQTLVIFCDKSNEGLAFTTNKLGRDYWDVDSESSGTGRTEAAPEATVIVGEQTLAQCPSRRLMREVLSNCFSQAAHSDEAIRDRDNLFRLRELFPDDEHAASHLRFQCFRRLYEAGLRSSDVLDALVTKGVLDKDGRVLRLASPRELSEMASTLQTQTEEPVNCAALTSLFITLACLYELRVHKTVVDVLNMHRVRWVNIEVYAERFQIDPEELYKEAPETAETREEYARHQDFWIHHRAREYELKGNHIDYTLDRFFSKTAPVVETIALLGENPYESNA